MSIITENSPKHCAIKHATTLPKLNKNSGSLSPRSSSHSSPSYSSFGSSSTPTKPQFSIKQVEVNQLNFSTQSLLNSSIQLTLLSINPNKKVGIYYDEFLLYASYKGQEITLQTSISPFYQGHEETNLLSASLVGNQQPVGPAFVYEVQRDQGAGKLALSFKAMGRLRWKVGTWVSGRYRFIVDCVTVMPFASIPSPPLRSKQGSHCATTI